MKSQYQIESMDNATEFEWIEMKRKIERKTQKCMWILFIRSHHESNWIGVSEQEKEDRKRSKADRERERQRCLNRLIFCLIV